MNGLGTRLGEELRIETMDGIEIAGILIELWTTGRALPFEIWLII